MPPQHEQIATESAMITTRSSSAAGSTGVCCGPWQFCARGRSVRLLDCERNRRRGSAPHMPRFLGRVMKEEAYGRCRAMTGDEAMCAPPGTYSGNCRRTMNHVFALRRMRRVPRLSRCALRDASSRDRSQPPGLASNADLAQMKAALVA